MNVLVVTDGYLPGYRLGGPIRAISAMVDTLGDDLRFHIVTSVYDLGEPAPYAGVPPDAWSPVGKAGVYYARHRRVSPRFWRTVLSEVAPDAVYLNSFFSPVTVAFMLWRRLGLLPDVPIVVAPRGEFSAGALQLKAGKKRMYLRLAMALGLYRDVTWQATAESERRDIERERPSPGRIVTAPNLLASQPVTHRGGTKAPHAARFVFFSRVVAKKNLLQGIELLTGVDGDVSLDVIGPVEDAEYWARCLEAAKRLPANVTFRYRGEIPHEELPAALAGAHFLLFPTHGENFGYTIAEALQAGLPVLVSDQTPWRNLAEQGVGWDLPLDDAGAWSAALSRCIAMEDDAYAGMSLAARTHARAWVEAHGGASATRRLFQEAARRPSGDGVAAGERAR